MIPCARPKTALGFYKLLALCLGTASAGLVRPLPASPRYVKSIGFCIDVHHSGGIHCQGCSGTRATAARSKRTYSSAFRPGASTDTLQGKTFPFAVQRMKCWRTYTVEDGVELEFEYYFDPREGEDEGRVWTSDDAAVCLTRR